MVGTQGDIGGSTHDGASFEDRLRAAEEKLKAEQAPKGLTRDLSLGPWGIGLRVGIELVSALILGLAIGWGLDHWLHTKPLFLVIFVLLGGAAGILNVWWLFVPRGLGGAGEGDEAGRRP